MADSRANTAAAVNAWLRRRWWWPALVTVGLVVVPAAAFAVGLLGIAILPGIVWAVGTAGVCFAGYRTGWRDRVRCGLFFLFAVLCTTFLWLSFQSAWLATVGVKTHVRVIESYSNLSGGSATHYATVTLPDGTKAHMTGTPDWAVGQAVDVYVDPVTSQPPIAASQIDGDKHITLWLGAASGLVALGSLDWRRQGSRPGKKRREELATFRDTVVSEILPQLVHGPWAVQTEVRYGWVTATNPEGAVLRFMLDERDGRQATHLYAPASDAHIDPKRTSTFRTSSPKSAVDGVNARLTQLEPRRAHN